jgi:hypothetical protein
MYSTPPHLGSRENLRLEDERRLEPAVVHLDVAVQVAFESNFETSFSLYRFKG